MNWLFRERDYCGWKYTLADFVIAAAPLAILLAVVLALGVR